MRPQDARPFIFQTGTPIIAAEVCETNNLYLKLDVKFILEKTDRIRQTHLFECLYIDAASLRML